MAGLDHRRSGAHVGTRQLAAPTPAPTSGRGSWLPTPPAMSKAVFDH